MNSFQNRSLVAALLALLLVSPVSALTDGKQLRGQRRLGHEEVWSGRHAMHYQIPKSEHTVMHYQLPKKAVEGDSDKADGDDDDDETDEDRANDKAREEQQEQLQEAVKEAKAKLERNLDEQEEISAEIQAFETAQGSAMIDSSVKAVTNETESAAMANYLGDMWKDMRMFQTPFYAEHLMEQREILAIKEQSLRKLHKAKQLELKKQKLAWEKEDAEGDAEDEADPKKKAEDEKKVAKLDQEEQAVEKEEKALDIFAPPPWMRNRKQQPKKAAAKPEEAAEDNTVKPDWMKSLEGSEDKKLEEQAEKTSAKDDEEEQETEEKKEKKAAKLEKEEAVDKKKKNAAGDDDDSDDEDEKPAKKAAKADDDDDDEDEDEDEEKSSKKTKDFDITGKPPWMKNKKTEKTAAAKEDDDDAPVEDNTVKPDWMKAWEGSDDADDADDSADEDKATDGKTVAGKEKKKKKRKHRKASLKTHGKHKAMFTKKTMPKVSPTVECVMLLTWMFFIVYTALAVFRSVNQLSANRFASCMRAQALVEMVCPYVMFAPMLCVLFLATRLRAIQLTQGNPEKYALPEPWVQLAMYTATYGVVFQAVFKLLSFMVSYRIEPGHTAEPIAIKNPMVSMLLTVTKFVFMGCIYGGFTAVCVGAIIMPAPKEIWGDEPPQVSAALASTMMLTITFFLIYLGLSLFRSVEDFRQSLLDDNNVLVKVQLLFWRARHSVNLAPMLCILFIVARMRALQMDPKNGNPPSWAQTAMYVCAVAIVFQVTASILLPLLDRNAEIVPGPVQGQIILVMSIPRLRIIGDLIRYIPLLCIYGGAAAVVASVFLMKAPEGEAQPGISASMRCIISLTTLYFVVFTAVYVAQMVAERMPQSYRAKRVITVLDAGQRTVMFAPMLCLLFIAARMRALQLTRTVDDTIPPGAGPQKWAQEGMYLSTWAVFLQVIVAYITVAVLGPGFAPVADDANVRDDQHAPRSTPPDPQQAVPDKRSLSPNRAVAGALELFKYLCLIAMYGGAVAVMVGIVIMTPETLPPYYEGHGVMQGLVAML